MMRGRAVAQVALDPVLDTVRTSVELSTTVHFVVSDYYEGCHDLY